MLSLPAFCPLFGCSLVFERSTYKATGRSWGPCSPSQQIERHLRQEGESSEPTDPKDGSPSLSCTAGGLCRAAPQWSTRERTILEERHHNQPLPFCRHPAYKVLTYKTGLARLVQINACE